MSSVLQEGCLETVTFVPSDLIIFFGSTMTRGRIVPHSVRTKNPIFRYVSLLILYKGVNSTDICPISNWRCLCLELHSQYFEPINVPALAYNK